MAETNNDECVVHINNAINVDVYGNADDSGEDFLRLLAMNMLINTTGPDIDVESEELDPAGVNTAEFVEADTTPGPSNDNGVAATPDTTASPARATPKNKKSHAASNEEYKKKRAKNNESVRKCREKAKKEKKDIEEQNRLLESEVAALRKENDRLKKELVVVKILFNNQRGQKSGSGQRSCFGQS